MAVLKSAPTHVQGAAPRRAVTLRVLAVCWLAILFEGYDVGVMGAVLPAMADDRQWNLSALQLGALSSYALVGMLLGALAVGTLSERLGRRRMLLACVGLFSLSMAGAAWAPTPGLFALFRGVGGLGLGGVIPVAAALTIEYSPVERRSFNYGLMYSGYSFGILSAAFLSMQLLQQLGWRGVIAAGALPLLLLWPMAKPCLNRWSTWSARADSPRPRPWPPAWAASDCRSFSPRRTLAEAPGANCSARCLPVDICGPRSASGPPCSAVFC